VGYSIQAAAQRIRRPPRTVRMGGVDRTRLTEVLVGLLAYDDPNEQTLIRTA